MVASFRARREPTEPGAAAARARPPGRGPVRRLGVTALRGYALAIPACVRARVRRRVACPATPTDPLTASGSDPQDERSAIRDRAGAGGRAAAGDTRRIPGRSTSFLATRAAAQPELVRDRGPYGTDGGRSSCESFSPSYSPSRRHRSPLPATVEATVTLPAGSRFCRFGDSLSPAPLSLDFPWRGARGDSKAWPTGGGGCGGGRRRRAGCPPGRCYRTAAATGGG